MPSLDDAPPPGKEFLDRLRAIVGPKGIVDSTSEAAKFERDERGLFNGKAAIILRPSSTEEVAAILKACNDAAVAVIPQGGNTGLVGGSTPTPAGNEIVLSLSRMNRIRGLDAANDTISVDAGCILAEIQKAAAAVDRQFALSLAAEGTCQIGGNLSTNAGGINVLRFGMAREQVLGLEVVLADGRILSTMNALRKDNTGYDLKQIFIGAEGTLGVITGAVLKLQPAPRETSTCLVAVSSPAAAIELLGRAKTGSGGNCVAFELTHRRLLDFVFAHIPETADPLGRPYEWYVLAEFAAGDMGGALMAMVEGLLERAFEDGLALDATIAASEAQRRALWRLRESMTEAQKPEGGSIKHDIAVPVSAVPEFLEKARVACEALVPGCRVCAFGHAGDGNIHFNVSQPVGADRAGFLARWHDMNHAVHEIVASMGGSISAEHGIGRLKRDELPFYKDAVAIDLMRAMKRAFDPNGILNPGRVIPDPAN
ncbi:MAG: FAD-binding protein [Alphaproteobacteria bacterium]|nr:FAD-binding protein [Alphaproteobacteria bacterium]